MENKKTTTKKYKRFEWLYREIKKKNPHYRILLCGDFSFVNKLHTVLDIPKFIYKDGDGFDWEGLNIGKEIILFIDYNYSRFTLFK